MKTFIIKRSKWARGGKNGASALLNKQGAMCCLGFFSLALGATPRQILGVEAPQCLVQKMATKDESLGKKWKRLFKGLVEGEPSNAGFTALCSHMMTENDSVGDESERDSKLTKMFAKLGWKPKFID